MRRFRLPALLLAVGAIAIGTAACSQADAAAGSASARTDSTASPAPATVAATSTVLAPAADSLSDSLLIARADKGRLMGRDSGAIWVVMISDFQCPYCKQWHDAAMANLKRDYVTKGQVRLAYLNLPLPQHKHARAEAEAALCAGVQDHFWQFAEQLFGRQEEVEKVGLIQPVLDSIARGLSLDMPAFSRCQQRQAIRALVESDVQQANKTGVRSTPSFLIGDFLVEGAVPYPDFRKAVDSALVVARNAKRSR